MTVQICCIKLSLAARVIAMVGLITSVLVLTQLFTEVVTEPEGQRGTVSFLLGLDIEGITDDNSLELKIGFLVFAGIYSIASSILIWGSIVEVSYYAFPWLVCQVLSFATQVATVAIISVKLSSQEWNDRWVVLFSICNLFISIYFWIVVFCAQRTWYRQKREERESTSTLSSGNDTINEDVFEVPAPPLPSKVIDL